MVYGGVSDPNRRISNTKFEIKRKQSRDNMKPRNRTMKSESHVQQQQQNLKETRCLCSDAFITWHCHHCACGCSCHPAQPRAHQGQRLAHFDSRHRLVGWVASFSTLLDFICPSGPGRSPRSHPVYQQALGKDTYWARAVGQAISAHVAGHPPESSSSSPSSPVKCLLTSNMLSNDVYEPTIKTLLFMVTIRMSSNTNARVQWDPCNWLFM